MKGDCLNILCFDHKQSVNQQNRLEDSELLTYYDVVTDVAVHKERRKRTLSLMFENSTAWVFKTSILHF